jgi:hypothetical protein
LRREKMRGKGVNGGLVRWSKEGWAKGGLTARRVARLRRRDPAGVRDPAKAGMGSAQRSTSRLEK